MVSAYFSSVGAAFDKQSLKKARLSRYPLTVRWSLPVRLPSARELLFVAVVQPSSAGQESALALLGRPDERVAPTCLTGPVKCNRSRSVSSNIDTKVAPGQLEWRTFVPVALARSTYHSFDWSARLELASDLFVQSLRQPRSALFMDTQSPYIGPFNPLVCCHWIPVTGLLRR